MKVERRFSESLVQWLRVVLYERFGHWFELAWRENYTWRLGLSSSPGEIRMASHFWNVPLGDSNLPCGEWMPSSEGYEALIAESIPTPGTSLATALVTHEESAQVVHFDILGLTWWMLSRAEEVGRSDLDEHRRFPAVASHAFRHDYLERPIVDEWMHVLGQVIQRQWPRTHLKSHTFAVVVSHDVDVPSRYAFSNATRMLQGIAGDVIRRADIQSAVWAPWIRANSGSRLHRADPANTFDWIMDVSEIHGLKSAFYFICGRTDPNRDSDYEPEHPAIRDLMRRIYQRGHEIGLHPSYNTYQATECIAAEANRLRTICSEEGIDQSFWGGRMHYLRWETPTTMLGWERAGMSYDSTLGYADRAGFRCGTCFEYPALNPLGGEALKLRLRPLIAMECTLISRRYMNLGTSEESFRIFTDLKARCRRAGGNFTMLWHNTELVRPPDRMLYARVLNA